ncbi:MAG TPA: MFS transporter [Solirubrobacteraceae bacterium]|jgi:EmrB/QacA subfamily drug resistance transporter|nr:MFS transporter [Solirubrobacteraceae bacterium]
MQRKWLIALIVCVGVFMSSLDLFIVNIAFPAISRHFHGASLGSLSWILSAYAIVFAALLVPAGRWADAFGRKRVFLTGLAVFVAASAACALAPSVGVLIGARVVQAAGGALMLPTSLGLMLPEFGPHERHVAIGVWAATGGIAAASGPPLGGLLVQADWRLVFLVNVPIGLAGLALGLRTLAERREAHALRPDVPGAGALMVAIGALVVAIVKGQEWGWGSAAVLALLATPLVLLPAIWRRSERHPAPIVEPAMLRVRSFGLAVGASLLFFGGFGAMLLAGVLFLTGVWHESVLTAGLMLFPGPAMATIFSIPSARLGARVGYRIPGCLGAALFAGGSIWWITHTGNRPDYLGEYLPGQAIGGAGVGLIIPTLTGAGASSLAPERFATGTAILSMGRQIGAALGVAVLVAVLGASATSAADFHSAWLISAGGALGTGLALAALGPPLPGRLKPTPAEPTASSPADLAAEAAA